MQRYARSRFAVAVVAAVVALGLFASRAWSDAGGAASAARDDASAEVRCVESHDGSFCLCRAGADVAAGEKAVTSCGGRPRGACCVSPVGFCYCGVETECTFAEDRVTPSCEAGMSAPAIGR